MRKQALRFSFLLIISSGILYAANPKILLTDIELTLQSPTIQLTLRCSEPIHYKYFTLSQPDRIVIDLPSVQLGTRLPKIGDHPTLSRIRYGYPKPHQLRLVLELKQPQKITAQPTQQPPNPKLVLRLQPHTKPASRSPRNQSLPKSPPHSFSQSFEHQLKTTLTQRILPQRPSPLLTSIDQATPNQLISRAVSVNPNLLKKSNIPKKPLRTPKPITIVIDPGHGGHDPGAVSRQGYEKSITLEISKKLQQYLITHTTFKVLLTRTQDKFIPLRGRLNLARRHRADLFLSIHADAFFHPYARGASVFALSLRGASSEAARWLAVKENYSELGGAQLHTKDLLLRSILIRLSQKVTITESLSAGYYILQALGQIGPIRGTVEQAPFVVLKSPDIPSLLIETGFLSNPMEARKLLDPRHQQRIAEAIAKGVQLYFKNNATRSL